MPSATQEISRDSWTSYFDTFSKNLGTVEVTLELVGKSIGDQIAADRLVLTGISYDHKDDVLVVGLDAPGGSPEEYEHLIYNPQKIFVSPGGEDAELFVDVEDGEGQKHILQVARPPALPAE